MPEGAPQPVVVYENLTEAARTLGITPKTLLTYLANGCPGNRGPGRNGKEWRIDPKAARVWITANRNPQGNWRPGPGMAGAVAGSEGIESAGLDESVMSRLTDGTAAEEEIQSLLARNLLPKQFAERAIKNIEVKRRQQELDKASGDLLNRAECESAWGQEIANLRNSLESLPDRIVPDLCAALSLTADQGRAAIQVISRGVRSLLSQLSANPLAESELANG